MGDRSSRTIPRTPPSWSVGIRTDAGYCTKMAPAGRTSSRAARKPHDPRRAAEALRLLRPRLAVPIHWGTYAPFGFGRLQSALLADPVTEFRRYAAELAPEVEVRVLDLGGTLHLDAVAGDDRG
jgi:L-ascorbate metabolism protein UlaG (beta-lactamase superfamily)